MCSLTALVRLVCQRRERVWEDGVMPTSRATSAHDAARELRRRQPTAGLTQIMKWLYIAQGLHLAWFGEPLFKEVIEAWENGPVVADYWHDLKEKRPTPPASELDERSILTLESVLDYWGEMTGQELSQMTHTDGGPWCQVTESLDELSPRNPSITHEEMRQWFSQHPVTQYQRERSAVDSRWSLVPRADAPGLREAVDRVMSGEVIQHTRPA